MNVGLLHPGEMGAAVGAALVGAGHAVRWAANGRRSASVARAKAGGLIDAGTVAAVVASSEVVIALCPPHAALEVARAVFAAAPPKWSGTYVEANAVAPATVSQVADLASGRPITVVDGAVIGPPPVKPGLARLYLSGQGADLVAGLWAGSPLEAVVMSEQIGDASALKLSFAAWSKGSQALVLAARAAAEASGVGPWLLAEWTRSTPEVPRMLDRAARSAATKGWRWVGEMEEVASFLAQNGLPDGFHRAAAEVFAQVPRQETSDDPPDLDVLWQALRRSP